MHCGAEGLVIFLQQEVLSQLKVQSLPEITLLFELEGTLKSHLVQLPCNEQGHLQLHQVAQSPIQPDIECLQGWGIHHLSGQPVPVPHFIVKNLYLITSLNLPSSGLKPFPLVLSKPTLLQSLPPPFL